MLKQNKSSLKSQKFSSGRVGINLTCSDGIIRCLSVITPLVFLHLQTLLTYPHHPNMLYTSYHYSPRKKSHLCLYSPSLAAYPPTSGHTTASSQFLWSQFSHQTTGQAGRPEQLPIEFLFLVALCLGPAY